MRSVVNHVVDGIISIDDRGTVTTFNPAAERIFGYAAQEVVGQNIKLLMPEPFHSEHDAYIANYLRTGQAKIIGIGREVVGRRKDGSAFPMDLAISVFRLGQGRHFSPRAASPHRHRWRARDSVRVPIHAPARRRQFLSVGLGVFGRGAVLSVPGFPACECARRRPAGAT